MLTIKLQHPQLMSSQQHLFYSAKDNLLTLTQISGHFCCEADPGYQSETKAWWFQCEDSFPLTNCETNSTSYDFHDSTFHLITLSTTGEERGFYSSLIISSAHSR